MKSKVLRIQVISYNQTEDVSQPNAAGEISELAVIAEGEDKSSWFIWLLVCCTSISGLLFGERTFISVPHSSHRYVQVMIRV